MAISRPHWAASATTCLQSQAVFTVQQDFYLISSRFVKHYTVVTPSTMLLLNCGTAVVYHCFYRFFRNIVWLCWVYISIVPNCFCVCFPRVLKLTLDAYSGSLSLWKKQTFYSLLLYPRENTKTKLCLFVNWATGAAELRESWTGSFNHLSSPF